MSTPLLPLHSTHPIPLPPYSWRKHGVELLYLRDHHAANDAISTLKPGPVGFDLEWKPTFRKGARENPVALVQIASEHKILLLHVSSMTRFPEKLEALLADPAYVKAGVNIGGDCKKLYNDYSVSVRSCVDLSYLARSVDEQWAGRQGPMIGLASLVRTYEHSTLPKGRVTISNWEDYLSDQQKEYAANDAHCGLTLYLRLQAMGKAQTALQSSHSYFFDAIRGELRDPTTGGSWTPPTPPKPEPAVALISVNSSTSQSEKPSPTPASPDIPRATHSPPPPPLPLPRVHTSNSDTTPSMTSCVSLHLQSKQMDLSARRQARAVVEDLEEDGKRPTNKRRRRHGSATVHSPVSEELSPGSGRVVRTRFD